MEEKNRDEELEDYGDPGILSKDSPVPGWLKWTYITLPIWGIITMWYYWNGSHGWLDRGYWDQLQRAALTTYPKETIEKLGNAQDTQKIKATEKKPKNMSSNRL